MSEIALFLISTLFVLNAQTASFPSSQILRSPNKQYQVQCTGVKGSENFSLILTNLNTKKTTEIYHFERNLSALWSPDSQTLAITDIPGSTYGTTLLIPISMPDRRVNLDELVLKKFPEDHWFMHRYLIAKRWVSSTTLEIAAEGHSDDANKFPTEFKFIYRVTTAGELARIKRLHCPPGQKGFTNFQGPCPK